MSGLEQEIKRRQDEIEKEFKAGNTEGVLAFYTPDCAIVPGGNTTANGKAEAKEVLKQFIAMGAASSHTIEEVSGSGDWAFARGTYKAKVGDGYMSGCYLHVWKKINGDWFMHNDFFTLTKSTEG